MTKKAKDIRQGDWLKGRKVAWVISNYLKSGKTEVKFTDGSTQFFEMDEE